MEAGFKFPVDISPQNCSNSAYSFSACLWLFLLSMQIKIGFVVSADLTKRPFTDSVPLASKLSAFNADVTALGQWGVVAICHCSLGCPAVSSVACAGAE